MAKPIRIVLEISHQDMRDALDDLNSERRQREEPRILVKDFRAALKDPSRLRDLAYYHLDTVAEEFDGIV